MHRSSPRDNQRELSKKLQTSETQCFWGFSLYMKCGRIEEMRYEDENIWLTQKMMATLYGVDVRTISDHIKKYILILNWKNWQSSENFG